MSEFFKLAYELIAKVIYNISEWVANFIKGFIKVFITGWVEYKLIVDSYFSDLPFIGKILAIILIVLLIAIPVVLIALLVRTIILNIKLRADGEDNVVLYREIGRLNKQVLDLIDEKNKILSMKVGSKGLEGVGYAGVDALNGAGGAGGAGGGGTVVAGNGEGGDVVSSPNAAVGGAMSMVPSDPFAEVPQMASAVGGYGMNGVGMGGGGGMASTDALQSAAIAAATAAAAAKSQAEDDLKNTVSRFPKLSLVDAKYQDYSPLDFDNEVSLVDFIER